MSQIWGEVEIDRGEVKQSNMNLFHDAGAASSAVDDKRILKTFFKPIFVNKNAPDVSIEAFDPYI